MLELGLFLLLASFVVLGALILRRPDTGPMGYWLAGWVSAGAAGILSILSAEFPRLQLLSFPFGSLFPGLLVAGSLRLAERRVPRWLLPAVLVFGAARAVLAATGRVPLAYELALAIEPFVVLAAAALAFRAVPRIGATLAERLLGPSFVVLAGAGALHVWLLMTGEGVPASVMALWMIAAPPVLAIQIQAAAEATRTALRRARDELEERVAERTAELRRSEERYRTVSELSSDLSFAFRVDANGRPHGEWVTDALHRITGFTRKEMDGDRWLSLIHPEDRDSARLQFDAVAAGRARKVELRIVRKDGDVCWLRIDVNAVRSEAEGGLRVVGAARDLTEARRADEERRELELHMQKAQRLESLGMLTGGIAHDFHNLLNVVLGNARLTLADLPSGSRSSERIARIQAAAEHGARLTEQLLIYSGKASVSMKVTDLSRGVQDMLELLRASVSEGCTLESRLSPEAFVEGDETQLRQVVLNLVTNASDALGAGGGQVAIATGRAEVRVEDLAGAFGAPDRAPGAYAFLEVSDTGAGMDAETQRRIFEPFFTTKLSGRGLGLAVVLGIVRAHGGLVRIQSAPGRGTTIRVLLPSAVGPGRSAAGPAGPDAPVTVLVVDDDPGALDLAQELLRRAGHRVLAAPGGAAALERLREHGDEIDAVILDVAMPDLPGDQVLLEMRRLRPDLPVVVASGWGADRIAERFPEPGGTRFVHKPYEPDELLAGLRAVLAERRLKGAPGSVA